MKLETRLSISIGTPLIALVLSAAVAHAQVADRDARIGSAESLLESCVASAERRDLSAATRDGTTAADLYRAVLDRRPRHVAALIGLARALSQCLLPAADLMRQGELSGQAIELLNTALEVEPTHWLARYVLAMNYYRAPSFLGRGPMAAKHFDELLRLQGDGTSSPRTDNPFFARVYEFRGVLHERAGAPDSARAVWHRAARLFPGDSVLQRRAHQKDSAASAPPSPTAAGRSASLGAVAVVARPSRPAIVTAPVLGRSDVLRAPGGAADLLQTVQLLPGATRAGDGSDIHARGGDPAETPVYLNSARMLYAGRFEGLNGGLFGVLDPFVLSAARFSSGGFSVRFGNALSGVLDVEADGLPRSASWRAGLNSVASGGATVRRPFGERLGGWITTRASHTGALLRTHGRTTEFPSSPWSIDAMGSVIGRVGRATELRAVGLVERDASVRQLDVGGHSGPFRSRADARMAVLSSRSSGTGRLASLRTNVTASSRTSEWKFGVLDRERNGRNGVVRVDADWIAGRTLLRTGLEAAVVSESEAGRIPTSSELAPGAASSALATARRSATHVGGYAETELSPVDGSSIVIGVRADRLPGESAPTVDPRIAIATHRGPWTMRLSGGVYHQGRWRSGSPLPSEPRVASVPRRAQHGVLGIERSGDALLRAEAFVKRYDRYVDRGNGDRATGGTATGFDILAQRSTAGSFTGSFVYSFLNSTTDLESGERVPSEADVAHTMTAYGTWTLGPAWALGGTVRYGSGAPTTPIVGVERSTDGAAAPVFGALASDRLPAYVRTDARLTRFVRMRSGVLVLFAEGINLFDRGNVVRYSYDATRERRVPLHMFFSRRTLVAGVEVQR
jgi:hypothetical protein